MSYASVYESWKADPETFWLKLAQAVDWKVFPKAALTRANAPFYTWFEDGFANTCFNAVDRHVLAGLGNKTALIYDSPVTNSKEFISYDQVDLQATIYWVPRAEEAQDPLK